MSRQDILDDPVIAYPQLEQFLGAYFHQDWGLDRDGWEPVVDDFVAKSPRPASSKRRQNSSDTSSQPASTTRSSPPCLRTSAGV